MHENFRVYLHPQPDEMTCYEAIVHMRRALFFDYVDGQWVDEIYLLRRDDFTRMTEWINQAHEREVDALLDENARLRKFLQLSVDDCFAMFEYARVHCGRCWGWSCDEHADEIAGHVDELRKLGIEVDWCQYR